MLCLRSMPKIIHNTRDILGDIRSDKSTVKYKASSGSDYYAQTFESIAHRHSGHSTTVNLLYDDSGKIESFYITLVMDDKSEKGYNISKVSIADIPLLDFDVHKEFSLGLRHKLLSQLSFWYSANMSKVSRGSTGSFIAISGIYGDYYCAFTHRQMESGQDFYKTVSAQCKSVHNKRRKDTRNTRANFTIAVFPTVNVSHLYKEPNSYQLFSYRP